MISLLWKFIQVLLSLSTLHVVYGFFLALQWAQWVSNLDPHYNHLWSTYKSEDPGHMLRV